MFRRSMAALIVSLLVDVPVAITAQAPPNAGSAAAGRSVIASGRVRRTESTRLFTLEDPSGASARRVVLVPRGEAIPADGSTVVVSGVLRPFDQVDLSGEPNATDLKADTILVARSVIVQNGSDLVRAPRGFVSIADLMRENPGRFNAPAPRAFTQSQSAAQTAVAARTSTLAETPVGPTTLASLIDELAGLHVRVNHARVVGVITPRVFLIEPATSFQMMLGNRDRVAILMGGNAELRVDPATLVGSTVTIAGTARTPLGLTVSRDVSWPSELTRDYMRRLEIRAAVLATSVQSSDGVELTAGSSGR